VTVDAEISLRDRATANASAAPTMSAMATKVRVRLL
jgi:hypothetical protein